MTRPTKSEVADHLATFARELIAVAETVDPSCAIDIDLREIADDAERLVAASFSGDGLARVETPQQLFELTDRAQDVRTGMDDPNALAGNQIQTAIEKLKSLIITCRVIPLANGGYEWIA